MQNSRKAQNKPATMRDVARVAGVSQPTVSRVLNQVTASIPVSDVTRERVLAAVEKLGYRPNAIARSLRTQRTQMIALLVGDISNSFYHPLIRAVQQVARQYDYEVLVSDSSHKRENERHFCEVVSRRAVDGVIMVPIYLTAEDLDQFLSQINAPVTVLGEQIHHPDIDVVYVNDEQATYEATRWLIKERGYSSLGYVGVRDDLPPGPRRVRGFHRAVDEARLTQVHCLQEGDFTLESGKRAVYSLLQQGGLPSALVVVNDLMAIGVILAAQELGYRVPDDVAVLGFDNIPEATIVRPALTTIAQDPHDIGKKLAEALFDRILHPSLASRRVYECSYELIARESA